MKNTKIQNQGVLAKQLSDGQVLPSHWTIT